mmetsp:Transcript_7587/g.11257  ORF Transcript_7587/g.11257 Transcript_7587/m.11257 type:complete len:152 (+) Transcript_7587:275-730(+)
MKTKKIGSNALKNEETIDLNEKNYKGAIRHYKRAVFLGGFDEELSKSLIQSCHLNTTQCYLSLTDYEKALCYGEKVLKEDATSIKGHVRVGIAHRELDNFEKSLSHFDTALANVDNNTSMKKLIESHRQKTMLKQKAYHRKQKSMFKKILG